MFDIAVGMSKPAYTLQEIFAYAFENSPEVNIIALEKEAARQEIRFYRSEAYPQVSFSSGARYTWFSTKGIATTEGIFPSRHSGDESSVMPSPYNYHVSDFASGRPVTLQQPSAIPDRIDGYRLQWNISLNQPLFTFGRVSNALKLARLQDSVIEKRDQLMLDNFYVQVIQSFSEAYLSQQQVTITQYSVSSAEKLFQYTAVDCTFNAASELDYLQAHARLETVQADLVRARGELHAALRHLAVVAGLPYDTGYTLAFDSASCLYPVDEEYRVSGGAQYRLKSLQTRMLQIQSSYERSTLFPTLYVQGGIGNSILITSQDTTTFPGIEDIGVLDVFNPELFTYIIGLQIVWTIFDGFRSQAQYSRTQLEASRSQLELQQLQERTAADFQLYSDRIAAIRQRLTAARISIRVEQKVYDQRVADYLRGYTDIIAVLDSEQRLRQAQLQEKRLQMECLLAVTQLKILNGIPVYDVSEKQ